MSAQTITKLFAGFCVLTVMVSAGEYPDSVILSGCSILGEANVNGTYNKLNTIPQWCTGCWLAIMEGDHCKCGRPAIVTRSGQPSDAWYNHGSKDGCYINVCNGAWAIISDQVIRYIHMGTRDEVLNGAVWTAIGPNVQHMNPSRLQLKELAPGPARAQGRRL